MNPDPNQPLQFDKADFAGQPTLTCASCKTPITSEYYQVNGKVICPNCREQFVRFGTEGSEAGRIALAIVVGSIAGIIGFFVYDFLSKLIHGYWSLLSIAVGWFVGTAVRWASKYRGGAIYQGIALVITYVAVCAVYLPYSDDLLQSFTVAMMSPFNGRVGIIGLLIIAFALYEAWSLNRKVRFDITGPHFTRQAPPPAAT
jgi:hypothetical protein